LITLNFIVNKVDESWSVTPIREGSFHKNVRIPIDELFPKFDEFKSKDEGP
jgi:hypothetical protein